MPRNIFHCLLSFNLEPIIALLFRNRQVSKYLIFFLTYFNYSIFAASVLIKSYDLKPWCCDSLMSHPDDVLCSDTLALVFLPQRENNELSGYL